VEVVLANLHFIQRERKKLLARGGDGGLDTSPLAPDLILALRFSA